MARFPLGYGSLIMWTQRHSVSSSTCYYSNNAVRSLSPQRTPKREKEREKEMKPTYGPGEKCGDYCAHLVDKLRERTYDTQVYLMLSKWCASSPPSSSDNAFGGGRVSFLYHHHLLHLSLQSRQFIIASLLFAAHKEHPEHSANDEAHKWCWCCCWC